MKTIREASGASIAKAAAHAAAGGTLNTLQGGKFGHGFLSAGVTEALSPSIRAASSDGVVAGTVASAVVGGTVSELSGGKFENGAQTGAFQFLFNQWVHQGAGPPSALPEESVFGKKGLTVAMQSALEASSQMAWPTDHAVITSAYGNRVHPVSGVNKLHNGTDIRARLGEAVYSVQDGHVLRVLVSPRGGNQLFIQNDTGSIPGYAHVAPEPWVQAGARVLAGDLVATSDGSGIGTAPHLHYTYRPGSFLAPATLKSPVVDPMQYHLRRAPYP